MRVYQQSRTTLVTGCTTHPGDNKFCSKHKDEQYPAVCASKLSKDNRDRLETRKEKEKNYKE